MYMNYILVKFGCWFSLFEKVICRWNVLQRKLK